MNPFRKTHNLAPAGILSHAMAPTPVLVRALCKKAFPMNTDFLATRVVGFVLVFGFTNFVIW